MNEMDTQTDRSAWGRSGYNLRRKIAAVAAYSLALTTVVVGAFPVAPLTPADAAQGDGVCYLIADSGGGNGGNDLLTIVDRGDFDPATNEISIGTGTGTYNIEAMDMHPSTLQLYATNADQLGTIDKLTGEFTPIGSPLGTARGALGNISIDDVDGLAFNYTTNVLYGSERQSGNDLLIQIDYATGSIVPNAFGPGVDYVSTNVATFGHDDIDDLAFHPFTNELYGSITGGGGPGRLVKLDPTTGIATDVGPFGAGDIEGMRFDAEGYLWGTSGTTPGQLFEINITTGAATNPRTVDNGGDYESTVCYVPGSDLWVDKSVDNQFPVEGSTVTYTVEIFNAGPANATGVVVEDPMPAGVTFVSASGQGTYDDTTGLWNVGSILRNESASIDITVSVDLGTAGSTITNTATRIAVDQGDAVPNNDTASVDIYPDAYADLAVSKTVSNASPAEGDTITYAITLINNGPSDATGVTINDSLPSGLTFVSADPSLGSYTSGVWTVGTVGSGATETLDITATVNVGTALTTITNTASVGNNDVTDPDPTNNSGSVDLTVSLAGLEIVKTSDAGGVVEPGQTITYTLDITNTGTAWLHDASVDDFVPPGTTYVPGSAAVTGFTDTFYLDRFNTESYSNSDGDADWTATSWTETGESTDPTGGDIQITDDVSDFQLRVRDDANSVQRSADLREAGAAAVTFDFRRDSLDNTSEVVYFEVAATPGGPWRQLAEFRGPATDSTYSDTGLLDLLPAELTSTTTFRFRTPSGDMGNGDLVWIDNFRVVFSEAQSGAAGDPAVLVAPTDGYMLAPGSTMRVTFQVIADSVLTQDSIDNNATADARGAIPASDSVSDRVARADLAVDKTVDNGTPNPGDTVNYTVTVTNNGPTAATQIELTDVLPSGLTHVSSSGTQGSYSPITGLWALGSLPPISTATLTITATVDSGTEGTTITNTATITHTDRPDPDPTNDEDSADIVVPVVDLEVDKSVDNATPNEGDTVVFSITVTNNGPDGATGVVIADTLPSGLTYVSGSGTQGSYSPITGLWALGSLPQGATETLTLTATVDAGTYGTTIVNTAAVEGVDQVDDDPSNDSDSARIGVKHNPAIQVAKDGPASAEIGETVTYTFTVSHTAASDGSPVTVGSVTDDVAGSAAFVSGDGNGNSLLDATEIWIYSATHIVDGNDPDPIHNTVTVTATDEDGEDLPDADDDHFTDIEHLPVLAMVKSGPDYALVGDTVTFTFEISHDATSDGTPVGNVAVDDDFAGAAAYVSGDDGDGFLEAGETWTYTATYTVAAGDPDPLINTGTATGTDEDDDPVEDSDTHSTDLIDPGVSISKTPDSQQVVTGSDATFTITVTNTGDVALSNVAVSDPLAADCDATFATLAIGATETYTCTVTNVTADFTNTASVTGDHPAGGNVGDTDTADVDVIDPSVSISKTPDTQQVALGDNATFTITVTNTGDVDVSNVAVTDALAPACDATFASLAAGATESYTCTVTNVTADFTNVADVTAQPPVGPPATDSDTAEVDAIAPAISIEKTPDLQTILAGDDATFSITVTNTGDVDLTNVVVTDPAAPACDVTYASLAVDASETNTCSVTNVTAELTNTADVTAQPPAGAPVGDTDTADVDVIAPAISIQKTPDTQTILAGDDATFTITVTNTGDVELTNVTVTDASAPGCDATFATLAVSASESYSCTVSNVAADFTNIADVTADHPAGGQVSDSDDADVDVIAPAVDIQKTPDTQQILAGDDATFTITVANTGDVELTNVAVTDASAPGCDATFATLAVGASESYACTAASVTADFTNIATVNADHPADGQVTASDTADVDVIDPAIDIHKNPDSQQMLAGGQATFTITVVNTGDVDLSNATVTDPLAPACSANVGDLAVGDSVSYLCAASNVVADFTNIATVNADHPAGGQVTAGDTADVDVIDPAVTIAKTPDNQQILSGDDANFTITVTNTGDVGLSNVAVTDALAPDCDATFAALAVGGSESYSCSLSGVTADFTNIATVNADHPAGGQVTAGDTAMVDVVGPAITVEKTPDNQQILAGDDATFTITVTNTGDVDLTNIIVTDAAAPDCDATFAALTIGESVDYTCTLSAVGADLTNVADVTADHPAGGQVTDSDDAFVDVVSPAVEIEKTPDTQQIVSGGDATFTITVTNTGDVDLTNVAVADPLAPNCDAALGGLAVGASTSYDCTLSSIPADFTNVADVTADHPAGGQVTDSDDAFVDVVNPAIDIQKSPDTQQIVSGGDATFTITVTNTGDVDLTNVTVVDPLAPDCDATFAALTIGESANYTCSLSAIGADLTNVADVTADHPAGGQVTDSDDAFVDVVSPAIDIQKSPDTQQIVSGGDATFTITVTNTGDVELTDVTVVDALAPDCDATFAALPVAGSETYSCSLTGVVADFTNVATVSANHAAGGSVFDSDVADVDVVVPSVEIEKTPDLQTIVTGSDATFTITVTNTGDVELSNVTVSDAAAPDCDATFATLAVGATESYDCTVAGVSADFTNVADVTAEPPVGGPVTDTDTADVDVITPSVEIQKTPDTQQLTAGSDATFTITVTNTGDVDLGNVTVTDALAPACDAAFALLAVGATESYDCTVTGVSADFTNVADVTADHPAGGQVTDSDDAVVDVIDPAIDVQKTPDTQQVPAGGDATFTITVTNVGDTPLSNVTVTDLAAPDCDATFASLAVAATETYSCTVANVIADFTNVADVTAAPPVGGPVTDTDTADVDVITPSIEIQKTPDTQQLTAGSDATFTITVTNTGDVELNNVTVTDALAPACDATFASLAVGATESYDCTVTGVSADFTNVADVTAAPPVGGPVTDTDTADVDVITPAIEIQKTPDTQQVLTGGDATFTITVTNTGDVELSSVTVTDAAAPTCDATFASLAVGATESYDCTVTGVSADFTNVADVTAEPPVGGPVTDSDDAVVDAINPSIDIEKTPDTQTIVAGDAATFTITVTNTGDVDLTNVTVIDAQSPDCDATIGDFAAGASTSYTCTIAAVSADFTNVAVVAGEHPAAGLVTDSDVADVTVIGPAIDIQKTPDTQTVASGDDATFTITVTNTGDVDLTNVTVTDALAPACDATFATLAIGATESYDCTATGVNADFTNVADVVAEHALGGTVSDSDTADVAVINPAIDVQKTPDTQTVAAGGNATFTITVTNIGDADLANVTVTDALAPACDATFATLAIGATESYDCTVTGVSADFTNIANVTAQPPVGGPVTDSDTADVDVVAPAIEVDKTPDTQTVLPGSDVTFTITVTNTGDTDLSNVTVTDALAPACDATFASLAIGATESYDCTVTGVSADFTNVADVTAQPPVGGPVTDSDDAVVDVIAPEIDIQKTPDLQTLVSGGDATFTITVSNTGDADLTNVAVTDALAPTCDTTIGDLAIDASTSYDCTVTGVTAGFTNVADVSGEAAGGITVSDSDTADVVVIGPAIQIDKTPDTQTVVSGSDVTFTITVTNTGDADLSNVVVTDPLAPACDATFASLAIGATESYDCGVTGVTADFTNVADVAADHPAGGQVTDSDDAVVDVIAPAIDIQKTPDTQQILPGTDAEFTITVTNTGDADLTNVTVTDVLTPACDATIGDLAIGESNTYSCTLVGVAADMVNTAAVSGEPPVGAPVTDTDDADVVVINPAIDIEKDPALQQILVGQDATFTITVTNIGDAPLTDVTISDPAAPLCDAVIPALGVGGSATVNCSVAAVTADFTNTASVVATHAAGGTVIDSDSADVEVLSPTVDIQKTPDLQIVPNGGDATFTITVTNAGVVPLSNVVVTDAAVPACDTTIGDLAVGASTTYTCAISGVSADFTNTATVDATDAAGNPATDSDTADVDAVAPEISISKSPDSQAVVTGGTATFTIEVTNTGDIDLTNVTVTDAVAPACDNTIGNLAVGASVSYTCDLAGITAPLTNTAAVTGEHAAGGSVSDSDTADVTVLIPAIDIEKTPDTQLVGPGGDATFTITVTNSGATALSNVVVTDALAPDCDATIGDLAIGETSSHTCTLSGVTADFTNTADVTGDDPLGNPVTDTDDADVDLVDPAVTIDKTPDLQTLLAGEDATFSITVTNTGDTDLSNVVVTDALAPACDTTFAALAIGESQTFGCTLAGVTDDFTNVASVTADTPLGTPVSDSDDALVDVITPGVEIQKTPDLQTIHSGDDAVFTITVTNTGDQDLVDLTVTDPFAPACDTTIAALAVGESTSYDCTLGTVGADLTNVASVSGTDALGNPVSDSDDAAVDVIDPAIDIQKTPDLQTIVSGGDATFTITVTNAGDVDLSGVTVSDPLAPVCDNVVGDLAAGASTSYTCSVAGVTAGFTNTASVTGTDPIGLNVTDSDTADVTVLIPAIDIQKTPDLQTIVSGGDATFTITVTNSGATALSNVAVTDALAPACDTAIGDLAVGESASFSCVASGVTADFTNVADVTGDDPLGNPVVDSDTADVTVISAAISISKSPDGQTVVAGGTATFTIEVTNTGDTDLTGVVVTDPQAPACDNTIGALAVGATVGYTCSVADVTADFTNTASVAGNDPLGAAVGDSDTADVTVLLPGIDIQKTPDLQTVLLDTDATFTIIVTNTGDTDLLGVTVSDPLAPECDAAIGDLPVGSSPVTYTCTVTVTDSFTNTASVEAGDPLGNTLTDEDTADVVALPLGGIEGTIAHDVNGDGVIGAGDGGFEGVGVTATWAGLDGVFGTADDEVLTTTTNSNGSYQFTAVPPGDYQVVVNTEDLPPGIDFQTLDPDSTMDAQTLLTVPPATTVTDVDFAFTATGFIGDSVFIDVDGNGLQGPTEPGVPGVWVMISWHGPDGVLGTADDLVYNTTTIVNGTYLVTGLPGGEFTVVVQSSTIPEGLTGDFDQSVTLAPGEGRDDVDFPLVGSGTIGDQVFEDLDLDGEFDAGEPGVPGVTVNANWAGFDGLIGTSDDVVFAAVTDANGQYLIEDLPAGEFVVAIDDSTVPNDLGSAPPVTVSLEYAATDLTADFPLIGNNPPVAVDDSDITDQDTPVTITVLDDDSDPDGHDFAIDSTTDPVNGSIVVNADGTITYTPDPGFWGVDIFTYTICELPGVSPSGIPATGLCDTAAVTVTVNPADSPNPGPGPEASFQSVVVGDPVSPMPVFDPDGGPVTVTFLSGDLPPGITWNPDGSFSGTTTEVGVYVSVYQVCDDDDPQICIEHTHTIAVTPVTLPGPGDPPDPSNPPDTLPFTGANFGELFVAALMLLITGAGLVLVSRRRADG